MILSEQDLNDLSRTLGRLSIAKMRKIPLGLLYHKWWLGLKLGLGYLRTTYNRC